MDRRTIAVFGAVTGAFLVVLSIWSYVTAQPFCAMAADQTSINGTTADPAMMDAPCTVLEAVGRTATSTPALLVAAAAGALLAGFDRRIVRGGSG